MSLLKNAIISFSATECLDRESTDRFFIRDPEDAPCYIVRDEGVNESKVFVVINRTKDYIEFISVDKCLVKDGSRCDFILYNSRIMLFVEMKLNTKLSSVLQDEEHYEKKFDDIREEALHRQIGRTIEFLLEKLQQCNVSIHRSQLRAIVCLPEFSPKNNTTQRAIRDNFLSKYRVKYEEAKGYIFD